MTVTPDAALIEDLAGQISGRLLLPGDADYDAARRVHNGLIDRNPAVIMRCSARLTPLRAFASPGRPGSTSASEAAVTTSRGAQ